MHESCVFSVIHPNSNDQLAASIAGLLVIANKAAGKTVMATLKILLPGWGFSGKAPYLTCRNPWFNSLHCKGELRGKILFSVFLDVCPETGQDCWIM